MRTSTKVWLFIALLLTLSGALIFAGAMAAANWDFTSLSTTEYTTNTYEITEDFKYVYVNASVADITVLPTTESTARVELHTEAKVGHTVKVSGETLEISTNDTRKWYDRIGISFESTGITLYLPADSCKGMMIVGRTGDITVQDLTIRGMTIKVTTGDVSISNLVSQTDINLQSSTGETAVRNVTARGIISTAGTGDITLKNVIAQEKFDIIRSTGDVIFNACDAPEIKVEVTTGDVMGTLLSDKDFTVKTSTGDVSVPDTNSGGICEIKTSTGDIKISITE